MTPKVKQFVTEIVTKIVADNEAIKATELAVKVVGQTLNFNIKGMELVELLDELVVDGKLREVQYIPFAMPDRMKSVYFSGGTYIQVMPPSVTEK